ncbi:hypothetical protein RvY_14353 [Ramazzottius varieornatus]|uniref:Uncharacterized protein n=1 Tax=Ramazzottius varieornatus TaxID=947166 RepID=A0A1D1VR18_RAMVA|nr:hypothetical protein RvY_14353 [Ramazzottius varieornatus]
MLDSKLPGIDRNTVRKKIGIDLLIDTPFCVDYILVDGPIPEILQYRANPGKDGASPRAPPRCKNSSDNRTPNGGRGSCHTTENRYYTLILAKRPRSDTG